MVRYIHGSTVFGSCALRAPTPSPIYDPNMILKKAREVLSVLGVCARISRREYGMPLILAYFILDGLEDVCKSRAQGSLDAFD